MQNLLTISNLSISFGGVRALEDVSIDVTSGDVAGLIGPNGSGKTTMFNCICGYYRPSKGSVTLNGREITALKPHGVARQGVGRTFQTPHLFADMTLRQNLTLAAEVAESGGRLLSGRFAGGRARMAEHRADALLEKLGLASHAAAMPDELSVGLAKLGDLARALAISPSLLLLDEPAVGLNDAERAQLSAVLNDLAGQHSMTILVVDHNIGFISSICSQITVLASGRVISKGTPDQVKADPAVIQAYLGDEHGIP